MALPISLSAVPVGAKAVLKGYPREGAVFLRFREMGMLPGTVVAVMRTAPLGDPLEIEVRGYRLTLRRSEADQITVELKG